MIALTKEDQREIDRQLRFESLVYEMWNDLDNEPTYIKNGDRIFGYHNLQEFLTEIMNVHDFVELAKALKDSNHQQAGELLYKIVDKEINRQAIRKL